MWHYPEDQRSSTIFRGFESLWMRVKAEASGWPSGVADDDDAKNRYIQEHRTRYGIEIDPSKVRKNASNRTLAKLCGVRLVLFSRCELIYSVFLFLLERLVRSSGAKTRKTERPGRDPVRRSTSPVEGQEQRGH